MESDTKSSTQKNWWSWTKTNTQQMTEQNAIKTWEPIKQKENNFKSAKAKQISKDKHWGRSSWSCWLNRDRDACKIQLQWAITPLLSLFFPGHPTKSYPHMYPPLFNFWLMTSLKNRFTCSRKFNLNKNYSRKKPERKTWFKITTILLMTLLMRYKQSKTN